MWTYETYDELYHHGIKGQKWGQRRFQYEDGSLTPDGRIRYGANQVKSRVATASKAVKDRVSTAGKTVKKNVSDKWNGLSDKQKKAIKIGVAAAGTALAAYAAYKITDGIIVKNGIRMANEKIKTGRDLTNQMLEKIKSDAAEQKWQYDYIEDLKKVANPKPSANTNKLFTYENPDKSFANAYWAREALRGYRETGATDSANRLKENYRNALRTGEFLGNDGKIYNYGGKVNLDGSYNYSNPFADRQQYINTKEEYRNFMRNYKQYAKRH